MPIPLIDNILNVLPPHLGDPRQPTDISPYLCSVQEICTRFNTSLERNAILKGFLDLRQVWFDLRISGFQWIDGSFLENVENQLGRPPGDIDVLTFVSNPADPAVLSSCIAGRDPQLLDHVYVKSIYKVDHFLLALGSHPVDVVYNTAYWYQLFSHRRDRLWKGMLCVELNDISDDTAARTLL